MQLSKYSTQSRNAAVQPHNTRNSLLAFTSRTKSTQKAPYSNTRRLNPVVQNSYYSEASFRRSSKKKKRQSRNESGFQDSFNGSVTQALGNSSLRGKTMNDVSRKMKRNAKKKLETENFSNTMSLYKALYEKTT